MSGAFSNVVQNGGGAREGYLPSCLPHSRRPVVHATTPEKREHATRPEQPMHHYLANSIAFNEFVNLSACLHGPPDRFNDLPSPCQLVAKTIFIF